MRAKITQKGYKQTDIGIIPEDWEAKPIDSEIDLLTGFPFSSSKYVSNGIKLLRGSNIKRGKTDWSEEITEYWDKVTFELRPYVLNEGDIVIAMDGSLVGKSFARLSKKDIPALLLQRVARIRSNKIDIGYLKEYICSDYFTKYCDSTKTVTAIPHISPQDIRKFVIALPPTKEEQSTIAEVLSDTDDLIESLDKLIEKKKNIKQGAMQELLTGKKRLPGFIGNISTRNKQTEIGAIPEDWEVVELNSCLDLLTDFEANGSFADVAKNVVVYSSENYSWYVRATDLEKNSQTNAIKWVDEKSHNFLKKTSLYGGELLITKRGEIGKVYLFSSKTRFATLGPNLYLLKLNKKTCPKFLFYYFKYGHGNIQLKTNNASTTMGALYKNDVKAILLPCPNIQEQNAIADLLSDIDFEIEGFEQKRDKYKQLKVGLMQQLLTGRIRLKWKS